MASAQGVSTIAFLDKDGPNSPDDFGDYQLYFWEGATMPAEKQFLLKPEVFFIYEINANCINIYLRFQELTLCLQSAVTTKKRKSNVYAYFSLVNVKIMSFTLT